MTQKITAIFGIAVMAAVLFGGLAFSQSAAGGEPNGEGCTPGYWKANADFKKDPDNAWTTEKPGDTLGDATFMPQNHDSSLTLLEALSLPGGDGSEGMEGDLLRHCVAAKLNAENTNVEFPYSAGVVITACNIAMATEDRDTMETLKDHLEELNDAGCPINMKGEPNGIE